MTAGKKVVIFDAQQCCGLRDKRAENIEHRTRNAELGG
jgi:hypothetical protein